jgi:hypothetical protein
VREKHETTRLGGDVALRLGPRDREEDVPAHGQLASDRREHHEILITDADDILLMFGTSRVAYFCLTDTSGKLRKAVRVEPEKRETDVAVCDVPAEIRGRDRAPENVLSDCRIVASCKRDLGISLALSYNRTLCIEH